MFLHINDSGLPIVGDYFWVEHVCELYEMRERAKISDCM